MGNAYSRTAPPLVEVTGPRSKIVIPPGSSFSFHPPHDRGRDRGRHRYPEYSQHYPRPRYRGRSPPFGEIGGDTEDFGIGLGRRRGGPAFDDEPFDLDPDGMRPIRPRRRRMGAMDDLYDEDAGGGFAGVPPMGQYAYPSAGGMGMTPGVVGMPPMSGVPPLRQPHMGGMMPGLGANPYAPIPQLYQQPGTGVPPFVPLQQQGMPMPMPMPMPMQQPIQQPQFQPVPNLQPQVQPQPQPIPPRRVRTAPPAHGTDEELVIDSAHHAALPRRNQVPRRGVSFDSSYPKNPNPATDFPREWHEGDPFLDACICPVSCTCRTGRRARFRKKMDDGRMESGTIRYEPGWKDGTPCRNGCTGHGTGQSDEVGGGRGDGGGKGGGKGKEGVCDASRRESRRLRKDVSRLGKMVEEMMMGGGAVGGGPMGMEMSDMPPGLGRGGRMPGGAAMGVRDPRVPPGMDSRGMRGMGMDGFPGGEEMDRFGMHPDMGMGGFVDDPEMLNYQMSRAPPGFMNDAGGAGFGQGRRRGGYRPRGQGRMPRPPPPYSRPPGRGQNRQSAFGPDEEEEFFMSGGRGPPGRDFSDINDDDAWTDAVDDDFGQEEMRRGSGRRASPHDGGRRGGRRGMGRHASRGNRRQAHVEDEEEGEM